MSPLVFYYCICACFHRCHSFSSSLCHMSPFHLSYVTFSRLCPLSEFTLTGPLYQGYLGHHTMLFLTIFKGVPVKVRCPSQRFY